MPVDHGASPRVPAPRSLFAASNYASVAAIIGYAPGFFIPIAIARVFGADATTDAFFLALAAASLIANALGATTQQAAIPFVIEARRRGQDVGRFVGEISVALLALAAIPTVVLNIGLLQYIARRAHWAGSDVSALQQFVWAFVPYIACGIFAGVYSGALNAEHRYVRVAASPALRSVTVLAALLLAPLMGVFALLAGYLGGEALRVVYLFRTLVKRYDIRVLAWPTTAGLVEFSRTALAQMLGSGLLACVPLLDRVMASQLGAGRVSILDYADRMWQVPVAFAMSGFMVTSLTHWSERLQSGGTVQALSRDTARAARLVFLASAPFAAAFVVYARPIVALVFHASKFTPADLVTLTDTLAVMVAVIPVYVGGLIYTRAYLVLKRSDWLLAINILQLLMKGVLNLLLMPRFGIVGIGMSTALTYTTSSLLAAAIFHLRLSTSGLNDSGPAHSFKT